MNKNPEVVPAEIRRVQKQFKCWRASKQGREQIPLKLWEAAIKLCSTYTIRQVAGWLRLNHTALKERTSRHSSQRPSPSKPIFVEGGLPVGILGNASSAEYVVETDGAQRIHVRGASVAEVAALARALRTDGSGG